MTHLDPGHWQDRLDSLAREHAVPGAAFGVLRLCEGDAADERLELATGVLHIGTGVATTPDSLFQVGSITKVWTTTLLMTLVDEGRLDLDAPAQEVLPGFRIADEAASTSITPRQLLSHTSGFDGDTFVDTGRGDDCVQKYVDGLAQNRQLFTPGTAWSYNNAAFTVAGRIVEQLLGTSWDAALRERVVEPLGLTATVTLPEDVLLHRAAVGHLEDDDGWKPTPQWGLPRSCGPAGLISSTVGDQLTFAAAHLRGGILSDASRAAMAEPQARRVDVTGAEDASSWGLGWALGRWDGTGVRGHDGSTIGQSAYLRLFPDLGLAAVLLTNGGAPDLLGRGLLTELLADVSGVRVPGPVQPGTDPLPVPEAMIGTWEQASARLEVRREDDALVLRQTDTSPFADLDPDAVWERPLTPYADGVALVQRPRSTTWTPLTHETTSEGVDLLHLGWRAHTRA